MTAQFAFAAVGADDEGEGRGTIAITIKRTVTLLPKFRRMNRAAIPAEIPANADPSDRPTASSGAAPNEPMLRIALAIPPMRAKRSPLDAPNEDSALF